MVRNAVAGDIKARAACALALRVHVGRLVAGHDEEPTEEAEAGTLIEALDAAAARNHQRRLEAILKASGGVSVSGAEDSDAAEILSGGGDGDDG